MGELLDRPTWSVRSLLRPENAQPEAQKVTPEQLHHLLRLSALPPPQSSEEEARMLDTLSAQLHFVGEIQRVPTHGVAPLPAIRDETRAAQEEQTVTLDTLKGALNNEDIIGKHHKRIRRNTAPVDAKDAEDWDVLGSAEKKVGRYFVVENERERAF